MTVCRRSVRNATHGAMHRATHRAIMRVVGTTISCALLAACADRAPATAEGTGTTAGAPIDPSRVAAHFPDGWRLPAGARATFAAQAMAVSNSPEASAAAAEILKAGGNAVDAAVALGFALAVAWPEAGNIGGGGYTVVHMADGRTAAIDYREVAPLAATRNMYVDANGKVTDRSIEGHLASGVPGAVAGLTALLAKFGTLPLARVMQPAIALARDGFVIDTALAGSMERATAMVTRNSQGTPYFPNGTALAAGARLTQPDLARTLQAIADRGADAFYTGWIADSLVAEQRRGGGIITRADLKAYTPAWREAIRTTYRGHTLLAMPPSSSGGVTMTEALNIIEQTPATPAYGSTRWFHLVGSAYQRAFIDRNVKIGDPAFVTVPLAQLTSKSYAKALAATIEDTRAAATKALEPAMAQAAREPEHTTHYSVVDAQGNAVATTTTLNNSWGSGVWVRGAGFMLNDEMDDFAVQPGTPNMFGLVQGEQNAIQPGKRMLSAMSPTIVLDSAGQVLLVVGAAGGPTIITGTSQVILNVIDHRMTLADAMRAPRVHHQALPDSLTYEDGGIAPAVLDSLRTMGYGLRKQRSLVNINAIMRVKGGWEGQPEPRRSGAAVGY
ncbi:MAG: gamma-glutamyltransferase [Gemmatimonadota bacterium]|nr:gamma-glutamyltransferase [Gemmatimonadota bacterium]MDQ8167177.1 gamma-glutamyltransferase [Gemmatimonadota bacterium]MDQ8172420.1 gamma-glutamyltransferase [Gemmatimonadota bacterium]